MTPKTRERIIEAVLVATPLVLVLVFGEFGVDAAKAGAPSIRQAVADEVLFTAPADPERRATRAREAELKKRPNDPRLAADIARRHIEDARRNNDPRALGWAEAALAPWAADAQAPSEILILRATIRQSRHDFAAALVDLDTVLARDPNAAQAALTRATVLAVIGRPGDARRDCEAVRRSSAHPIVAATCNATLDGLTGKADAGRRRLDAILAYQDTHPIPPGLLAWALGTRGELGLRLGDTAAAEADLRRALELDASDAWTIATLVDLLLDVGRPAEAVPLVAQSDTDNLVLRRALAKKAAGQDADPAATTLRALRRLARARRRAAPARGGPLRARLRVRPEARPRPRRRELGPPARAGRRARVHRGGPGRARPGARATGPRLHRRHRPGRRRHRSPARRADRGPGEPAMTRVRALVLVALGPLLALGLTSAAHAHQPSQGFVIVSPLDPTANGLSLRARWDLALRDVDRAVGLDADEDGKISGAELAAGRERILAWAKDGQAFATSGACLLGLDLAGVTTRLDGPYVSLAWVGTCPPSADDHLEIRQSALFPDDPGHRVMLRLGDGSAVLRADAPSARLAIIAEPDAVATFGNYIGEGVLHIWGGIDHIFFLVALLLPAVLRWRRDLQPPSWQVTERLKPALLEVLKVVTAFTLAHSITLVLSTLGVVRMPSVVTETAIALSVALAALNNLRPVIDARWTVAFGLGLLHGFGFSSVLLELGLPDGARALALAGFNVGVELGQMTIVLAIVPLAFAFRHTRFYRLAILTAGSIVIAAIALYWSAARSGLVAG
ncbi:MAG: HupE/UreJ family protein [Myxococcota bacterium]